MLVEQIPRLRRYARALVGDPAQADDLVQDCLERAWRRLHLWEPGSDLRAWLFTVLHNLTIRFEMTIYCPMLNRVFGIIFWVSRAVNLSVYPYPGRVRLANRCFIIL